MVIQHRAPFRPFTGMLCQRRHVSAHCLRCRSPQCRLVPALVSRVLSNGLQSDGLRMRRGCLRSPAACAHIFAGNIVVREAELCQGKGLPHQDAFPRRPLGGVQRQRVPALQVLSHATEMGSTNPGLLLYQNNLFQLSTMLFFESLPNGLPEKAYALLASATRIPMRRLAHKANIASPVLPRSDCPSPPKQSSALAGLSLSM